MLLIQPTDLDSPVRLPGDQPVLPDGTINLGRYGLLMVSGRTIEEIESLVRTAVEAVQERGGDHGAGTGAAKQGLLCAGQCERAGQPSI